MTDALVYSYKNTLTNPCPIKYNPLVRVSSLDPSPQPSAASHSYIILPRTLHSRPGLLRSLEPGAERATCPMVPAALLPSHRFAARVRRGRGALWWRTAAARPSLSSPSAPPPSRPPPPAGAARHCLSHCPFAARGVGSLQPAGGVCASLHQESRRRRVTEARKAGIEWRSCAHAGRGEAEVRAEVRAARALALAPAPRYE